jgi:cell division septum initiation protein DivIVA
MKEQARREADLILSEAHAEARSVTQRAVAERERLLAEARRIRALLRGALTTIDVEEEPEERSAEAA